MFWALGTLIALLLCAGLALQIAIWRNGPAVLDGVDRLTGGDRNTAMLTATTLGGSAARKVSFLSPGTDLLPMENLCRKSCFMMKIVTLARLVIYAPKVRRKSLYYHLKRNMKI